VLSKENALPPCQLLVNATSIGMRYSPLENESPISPAAVQKDALIYDLVYNPVETVLLKQAKSVGAKTLGLSIREQRRLNCGPGKKRRLL
jgi:shikimate dehydrogenase